MISPAGRLRRTPTSTSRAICLSLSLGYKSSGSRVTVLISIGPFIVQKSALEVLSFERMFRYSTDSLRHAWYGRCDLTWILPWPPSNISPYGAESDRAFASLLTRACCPRLFCHTSVEPVSRRSRDISSSSDRPLEPDHDFRAWGSPFRFK